VPARKKIVLVHDDTAAHQSEAGERLLTDERAQDIREAVSSLPWQWQQRLELLMTGQPASYAEISRPVGLPVGGIGPHAGDAWPGCAFCCRLSERR
jgi:hypothetical protein